MISAPPVKQSYRIGMVVPSSNTTMETEIPHLLQRQPNGPAFTFHSARVRLLQVTPEALHTMNQAANEAVDTLCDAQVDSIMYACLVATMYGGKESVLSTEARLRRQAQSTSADPTVISSAGALITALKALNARKLTLIAPYKPELTGKVVSAIQEFGFQVKQTHSLGVADNVKVGRLDPRNLLDIAAGMDLSASDALIISACVQMPSLAIIAEAEARFGLPVISAATASAYTLLTNLGIRPAISEAGRLLENFN